MRTQYWYWIWKTFLGPSRLRKKFVRNFLVAGLVPLVLMGLVSIYLVNLTHRIDVEALEGNAAEQLATEIGKVTDKAADDIKLEVAFDKFAPIEFGEQDILLEFILRGNSSIKDIAFVCATPAFCNIGRETRRWIRQNGSLAGSRELRDRKKDTGFNRAKDGMIYFGPAEFGEKGLSFEIAAPNFNKKREIVSVIVAEIDIRAMQSLVESISLGRTGYAYVTENQGRIILHKDSDMVGKSTVLVPIVNAALKDKNKAAQATYPSLAGETVSGAAEYIQVLGWASVVEWPRAETQELVRTIMIQIGGFSLLALLVTIIVASLVALRLIQPIAELRQGTSVIGAGNFDYRVHVRTGDELEDLGANLNKMAESLKGLEEVHELRLRTELLAESLKKEQELSKLKDQFITTVSHQFNTPLSVINWSLATLREPEVGSEKIKETADAIEKSQKDIVAIVSDLVTLADIGFRYQKVKSKPVDITILIRNAVESTKEMAKLRKLTVNFTNFARNTVADVNAFTMQKVFENLINNAISYGNEGSTVEVRLDERDHELIFAVTDRGIGITKEDQPLIFQQFFRSKEAVSKKNAGTGLGLFIVKNIIEGHGGKVWFSSEGGSLPDQQAGASGRESTEGKGTTFYTSIPR